MIKIIAHLIGLFKTTRILETPTGFYVQLKVGGRWKYVKDAEGDEIATRYYEDFISPLKSIEDAGKRLFQVKSLKRREALAKRNKVTGTRYHY